MKRPVKSIAKWSALTLGALLILLLGVIAWSLNTQSGARSVARIAVNALGGKLALGNVEGTIAGPLTVTDLRYNDPEIGVDARLQRVHVDIVLADIFRARVHVHELQASGIDVALHEPTKPPEPKKPFSLKPPIDIEIDSLALDAARIRRDETPLVELTRAAIQRSLDVSRPVGQEARRGLAAGRDRVRRPCSSARDLHRRWTWELSLEGRRAILCRCARHAHRGYGCHADSQADGAARSGIAGAGHADRNVAVALHARSAAFRSARGAAAGFVAHEPRRLVERARFAGARGAFRQVADQ